MCRAGLVERGVVRTCPSLTAEQGAVVTQLVTQGNATAARQWLNGRSWSGGPSNGSPDLVVVNSFTHRRAVVSKRLFSHWKGRLAEFGVGREEFVGGNRLPVVSNSGG